MNSQPEHVQDGSSVADASAEPRYAVGDVLARMLTELLAPWILVVVLPLAVAREATSELGSAVGWGLLVVLTSSILPMVVIVWGARSGRWDGHHVRNRQERLVPFLVMIALSGVGLALLLLGGAPWLLTALDISMVISLLAAGAVTLRWKISMHTAVASGTVAMLAETYGPALWMLSPLVIAIAWSRVRVRDHTVPQVATGGVLGAVVGGGLFALLS